MLLSVREEVYEIGGRLDQPTSYPSTSVAIFTDNQSFLHSPTVLLPRLDSRHPRHEISTFTNELNLILEKLTLENKTVLITGDFNVDLFRVNNNRYISDYNDMMLSYHMNNEIKSATRITDSSM